MEKLDMGDVLESSGDGVRVRIKVVPGASRDHVAGVLGDRLKLRVAAPAEGGRANAAVCETIADFFGVERRDVIIETGQTQPQKVISVVGLSLCRATEAIQALKRK